MSLKVELRAARIPGNAGYLAVHYWFVISQGENHDRWEIWNITNQGENTWNHLHKNLADHDVDSGVGAGNSLIEKCWEGTKAERIAQVIETTPKNYPYRDKYRRWPGPNSNTYVQWVLNHSEANYLLSPSGIGKDYQEGLQYGKFDQVLCLSSALIGCKINGFNEWEWHILTLTFGFKFQPFLIKIPFFRYAIERNND